MCHCYLNILLKMLSYARSYTLYIFNIDRFVCVFERFVRYM